MFRRIAWYIFAFVVLLIHAYTVSYLFSTLPAPVEVSVSGLEPDEASTIQLERIGLSGNETILPHGDERSVWPFDGGWYRELRLWIPRTVWDHVEHVQITAGERTFHYTRNDILARWQIASEDDSNVLLFIAPEDVKAEETLLPGVSSVMNWPGIPHVLRTVFLYPPALTVFLIFAIILAAHLAGKNERFARLRDTALEGDPTPDGQERNGTIWFGIGAAVFIAALAILESIQPYYFVQDDNYGQFLPVMIDGCRNLFSGVFPEWNPYQFLGCPTASQGVYGLTYPVTWLSYAIATYLFGNELLMFEVYAALHLAAAYAVTFLLCRRLGLRPGIAVAASLSFTLSGYFLIAGRSWIYMLPVAVWTPLLVLALERLRSSPVDWKWIVGTGLVVGLFFHAGNAQMWFYALTLICLAAAVYLVTGNMTPARAARLIPALMIGAAIAAPLLIPQMMETADVARPRKFGGGITYDGLLAMVFPWPLVKAGHPKNWGNLFIEYMGHLYYSGTVFAAMGILGSAVFAVRRWTKNRVARNVWLLCGTLALVFSLGRVGIIWDISLYLPVLGKFKHAFKFLPFVMLFFAIGGGLMVERLLRDSRNPVRWEYGLVAVVGVLLLYHAFLARPAFYNYIDKPFRPLLSEIQELKADDAGTVAGRIATFAPVRSVNTDYTRSTHLNMASFHRVPALSGFDPLAADNPAYVEATRDLNNDPPGTYRAYGVSQLIAFRPDSIHYTASPDMQYAENMYTELENALAVLLPSAHQIAVSGPVRIWRLDGAKPMAFTLRDSSRALPLRVNGGGAVVDVASVPAGDSVVVNYLRRPFMNGSTDGAPVNLDSDSYDRIRFAVPDGASEVAITYDPPWGKGAFLGTGIAIAAVAAIWGCRKYLPEPVA